MSIELVQLGYEKTEEVAEGIKMDELIDSSSKSNWLIESVDEEVVDDSPSYE